MESPILTATLKAKQKYDGWIEEVREHQHSAMIFAKALLQLYESGMWKDEDPNWASFCESKFAFSRDQSYRYVRAARFQIDEEALCNRLGLPFVPKGVDAAVRKAKPAKVAKVPTADSEHNNPKSNYSKPVRVKLEPTGTVTLTAPAQTRGDIAGLVDSLAKHLDNLLRRNDIPFEAYQQIRVCLHEADQARGLLQGVLKGFEPIVSKPKFKPPTLPEVQLFCAKSGIAAADAEWFWNKMEGCGWKNGGKPVCDWSRTLIAWKIAGHLASQKVFAANGRQVPKPKSIAVQDLEQLSKRLDAQRL